MLETDRQNCKIGQPSSIFNKILDFLENDYLISYYEIKQMVYFLHERIKDKNIFIFIPHKNQDVDSPVFMSDGMEGDRMIILPNNYIEIVRSSPRKAISDVLKIVIQCQESFSRGKKDEQKAGLIDDIELMVLDDTKLDELFHKLFINTYTVY